MNGFHCSTCGRWHDQLPLAFGADAPVSWRTMPADQLGPDDELTSDQCVLGDRSFFVRGCLDLPIRGSAEVFRWGVWLSVSREDFLRICDLWDQPGRESEPPFQGRLDILLPLYAADTLGLPVRIQTRPVGERPQVFVADPAHPLHREQTEGLTWDEVRARAEQLIH